jgi:hypothetical protein
MKFGDPSTCPLKVRLDSPSSRFRQAEISDSRLIVGVDQHVRRLQVTVQDAPLVCIVDRPGNQLHVASGFLGRQRLWAHPLRKALAIHVIHGEKVPAFVDTHIVNCDNVRMLENGGRRGLSAKALDEFLSRQRTGQNHFQSDDPAKFLLPGLVHDSHAAPGNLLQEIVVSERIQWHRLLAQWRRLEVAWIDGRFGWVDVP